jgi:hypothetical protein
MNEEDVHILQSMKKNFRLSTAITTTVAENSSKGEFSKQFIIHAILHLCMHKSFTQIAL